MRLLSALLLALTIARPVLAQTTSVPPFEFQTSVRIVPQAAPRSPIEGQIYQNETTHEFMIYNGSRWVVAGRLATTYTTVTTTDKTLPIYRGATNPDMFYASNYAAGTITLANGLARASGLVSYYKFAPTDSDAAGVDRSAIFGYAETGGTLGIGADIVGLKSRALHLGTGTMDPAAGIFGLQGSAFNGHAGAQGSTGGNVSTMYGARVGSYQQSTNGAASEAYGVSTFVEHDYGTLETAIGLYTSVFGMATPTEGYGLWIDTVKGTTKWSIYATDATAPSHIAGNLDVKSVRSVAVLFAGVPSPAVEGMLVPVTDSSTNTWGATITGSGSNHVLAYYDGTNWTVAAK